MKRRRMMKCLLSFALISAFFLGACGEKAGATGKRGEERRNSVSQTIKKEETEEKGERPVLAKKEKAKNIIRVNSLNADKIMLSGEDKSGNKASAKDMELLNKKNLVKHFGKNVFPKVPKDLKERKTGKKFLYPVYLKKGKILYDRVSVNYWDKTFRRYLSVDFRTGKIPSSMYRYKKKAAEASVIHGTKVLFFEDRTRKVHYAEFMSENVGFLLSAKRLKKKEFITAIASLTEKKETGKKTEGKRDTETSNKTKETAYFDFAADLFKQSMSEEKSSLISPFSVFYAMGMTANGAAGTTREEIEKVFGMSVEEINAVAKKHLKAEDKLKLANAIRFKDSADFKVNEDFLKDNTAIYDANIKKALFDETTLKELNDWVEKKTDGRVKNILDRIDDEAVMYLVNALAFEAEWRRPFKDDGVREVYFTPYKGEKKPVKLMTGTEYRYLEDGEAKGFVKYYKDSKYALACLLPNEKMNIIDYSKNLTGKKLKELFDRMEEAQVFVGLPAFKTEYETGLKDAFRAMGVMDAFDPGKADFSKLGTAGAQNIFINRVLHKTFMEVDRLGTKAGAATVVEMTRESAPVFEEREKEVILDRPFLYMMIDTENNYPIFIGNVLDI